MLSNKEVYFFHLTSSLGLYSQLLNFEKSIEQSLS